MKLTESRIKQIILEELHNLAEEEQEEQPLTSGAEEPKAYPEVEVIMRLMPKINSFKKYQQLIEKVLAHNFYNILHKVYYRCPIYNIIP